MKKEKITIEYTFNKGSLPVLWNLISSPLGLSEWFADNVDNTENQFTFFWDKNSQNANLIQSKLNSYVRFQWEEDEGTNAYFEMKIETQPLTNEIALLVEDFAFKNEKEDIKLLWDHQIETLRRKTGM